MKCFMKSFTRPKTALETKSASKTRAEKDYEVVDLKYWDHLETYRPFTVIVKGWLKCVEKER